jgi:predicted phosphoserine aminotransferase
MMSKLFLPGPTDVLETTLEAQTLPMIGHRDPEFTQLFERIQRRLRSVFQTEKRVFILASSGTGLWEGAMRNCVHKRLLLLTCGAFGERWKEVASSNGLEFDVVESPWGLPNTPEQVESALKRNAYDTLAFVHNETSTGVENPLQEIAARARRIQPDLIIMVDAVSSAAGMDIRTDEWGLDVVVASSQKCFALPPGLAFAAVSDQAMERARSVAHRGWYFDFHLLEKYLQRNMTPATPAISLLFALDQQLEHILSEGLQNRFTRHAKLASTVQGWAQHHFSLFAAPGFRSRSVTTVRNSPPVDLEELSRFLAKHGMKVASGYGKLRHETFRIGHMGEHQPVDIETLLLRITEFLKERRKAGEGG